MEDKPILKKTFYTVAVMLASWVAFIGTVSFLAVFVTSRAVGTPASTSDDVVEVPASHVSDTSIGAAGAHKSAESGHAAKAASPKGAAGTQI